MKRFNLCGYMMRKNLTVDVYSYLVLRAGDIYKSIERLKEIYSEIDTLFEKKEIGKAEHKKLKDFALDTSNVLHGQFNEINHVINIFKQWGLTKKKNRHS